MKAINRFFNSGSDKDEPGGKIDPKKNEEGKEGEQPAEGEHHEEHKHMTFKEKLQEWANDNEDDIEEDDSTPLYSGL